MMKHAMTKPKADSSKPKKVKNIERSKLTGKTGRLHVPRQELGGLTTARFKATRKPPKRAAEAAAGGAEGGGEGAARKKRKK